MKKKTTVLLRAGLLLALLLVLIWIWPAIVLTSWSFSSGRPRQLRSVGRMKAAMDAVPPAILTAVIAPAVFLNGWAEMIAGAMTLVVALLRAPLLVTIATGVALVVALRYLFM